jgi:hypothetical protein
VLTLARVYGLQWNVQLTFYAAVHKKYELLRWLHKCGCPWDLEEIVGDADDSCNLEHMKQLRAVTGPWPAEQVISSMSCAASCDALDIVKWCHEQGAVWPESFYDIEITPDGDFCSLRCVEWALANGSSTWLTWRCQDLAPQHYQCDSDGLVHSDDACSDARCQRKHAAELFTWAHENGCPCTCNETAAAAAAAPVM